MNICLCPRFMNGEKTHRSLPHVFGDSLPRPCGTNIHLYLYYTVGRKKKGVMEKFTNIRYQLFIFNHNILKYVSFDKLSFWPFTRGVQLTVFSSSHASPTICCLAKERRIVGGRRPEFDFHTVLFDFVSLSIR